MASSWQRLAGRRNAPLVPGPPARVLFLGTHGQGNVGDELLARMFLTALGPRAYSINSYDPAATATALHDLGSVRAFSTSGSKLEVARCVRDCDVVVFGGGSIVKELYPTTGRWRYSTLCMVLAIVVLARLLRRPVLMSNVGVGPIDTPTGRALAGAILAATTLVSVRDEASAAVCRRVRCRAAKLRVVPDAVFALAPPPPVAPPPGDALRLALSLNRDIARHDEWDGFLDRLEGALRTLARRSPIEVHGLAMQSMFKADDDRTVLEVFLRRLEGVPGCTVTLPDVDSHEDVLRIVDAVDVVLAERFHAIVLAAISGRPVVPLVYDVKVAELARQLSLDEQAFEVGADLDPDALAAALARVARLPDEGPRLARAAASARRDLDAYLDDVRRWVDAPSTAR